MKYRVICFFSFDFVTSVFSNFFDYFQIIDLKLWSNNLSFLLKMDPIMKNKLIFISKMEFFSVNYFASTFEHKCDFEVFSFTLI